MFTTSEEEEMRETEPSNIHEALANNKWTQSMEEEINKLKEMETYIVVPRPTHRKVVKSVWPGRSKETPKSRTTGINPG